MAARVTVPVVESLLCLLLTTRLDGALDLGAGLGLTTDWVRCELNVDRTNPAGLSRVGEDRGGSDRAVAA